MRTFSSGRNWPEQLAGGAQKIASSGGHAAVNAHAPALTAGNAQRADNSSPRRSHRRPELRRAPARGSIHILLARFEEPARFGTVVVAGRGSPTFWRSGAAVPLLV